MTQQKTLEKRFYKNYLKELEIMLQEAMAEKKFTAALQIKKLQEKIILQQKEERDSITLEDLSKEDINNLLKDLKKACS